MKRIVGIDIGNSTTEAALAEVHSNGEVKFLSSAIASTTGIKGTRENIVGLMDALKSLIRSANLTLRDIDLVRINEATPVIGDVAMETITETIITESTMIGHNPKTPGGLGLGVGYTVPIEQLIDKPQGQPYIVVAPKIIDFELVAQLINAYCQRGYDIRAAILQADDGVEPGQVVSQLSNPYGIATVFELSPEETKNIVPIARALIGNRSAVVIKTPAGDVKERVIPAGSIIVMGNGRTVSVDVSAGAERIMETLGSVHPIDDISGEAGTNVGGMLEKVRLTMAQLTNKSPQDVFIQDLLAVDVSVPINVKGGLAGEFSMEQAVGIASMVKSDHLQMEIIAKQVEKELGIPVEIGGEEAESGSTDASIINQEGKIKAIHLAGAGNMVTMLINSELGLEDMHIAEAIKRDPLAQVLSVYHIRHEDGTVQFFNEPLSAALFGRVVIVTPDGLVPVERDIPLETIKRVRQTAKKRVFVTNSLRALASVSPTHNVRDIPFVVIVGGSALDFEIPQLVTDELSQYALVAGRGNIRGVEGARNAVATGLVLSYVGKGGL